MTSRHYLNDPELILSSYFFLIFHDFANVVRYSKDSRNLQDMALISSERASKTIRNYVEFVSYHGLGALLLGEERGAKHSPQGPKGILRDDQC